MYTREALSDIHDRTHRSLARLLAHCAAFAPQEADREFEGFGYPNLRLQIHHVLGAERYWLGVIHGRIVIDDDAADFPTIADLCALRERVASATASYLDAASAAELNTPRAMTVWGGKDVVLAPARVIVRTQTHVYQHQGQVVAMCRLLGRPAAGMDFPIA